jgi:hypothetical protein
VHPGAPGRAPDMTVRHMRADRPRPARRRGQRGPAPESGSGPRGGRSTVPRGPLIPDHPRCVTEASRTATESGMRASAETSHSRQSFGATEAHAARDMPEYRAPFARSLSAAGCRPGVRGRARRPPYAGSTAPPSRERTATLRNRRRRTGQVCGQGSEHGGARPGRRPYAPRAGPPPAGIVAAEPAGPSLTARAAWRDAGRPTASHATPRSRTGTERTGGRTAPYAGSTRVRAPAAPRARQTSDPCGEWGRGTSATAEAPV